MSRALEALFGSETKVRVLEVLLNHPGQTFHLRGLAAAANTDSGNTSKLLRSLVGSGLVISMKDSHSTRYSINERSEMTAPLRQLIQSAGALITDLRVAAHSLDALYVAVYGSVASGTDDDASDVDVLVVGDVGAVSAQAAFKPVARRHGRPVNALAIALDEFRRHLATGSAFWSSLAQEKRIDLKGEWSDAAISQPTGT